MTKSVVVLGVAHELQGPRFIGYVDDPSYPLLLKLSMRGVDFVFEEASGLGPSIAENLANSILGPGHYVDVDPSASQRGIYRIVAIDMGDGAIDRNNSPDRYVPIAVEPHKIREELWARRIDRRVFKKAIAIVGIAHSLSIAFRLESLGIDVKEIRGYTPYDKLCRRKHSH